MCVDFESRCCFCKINNIIVLKQICFIIALLYELDFSFIDLYGTIQLKSFHRVVKLL